MPTVVEKQTTPSSSKPPGEKNLSNLLAQARISNFNSFEIEPFLGICWGHFQEEVPTLGFFIH